MAKAKVIVFDLFETLLHDIKFDFIAGLSYLFESVLSKDTDKVEFLYYASTYWKECYDKRCEDNSEISFEDELLDFINKYGFRVNYPLDEILYHCAIEINSAELFHDTITTLEQLKLLGIPVYLLSNSIFKKSVMEKYINQYDLGKYFVNTYFSADYKIRKPHKDLFKNVFDDISKYVNGIETKQVYFIGDNMEADVLGSKNFGFTPVFINRKHETDQVTKDLFEIRSLTELLELIR